MTVTNEDCLSCGACCRSGHDGRILVPKEDLLRWFRAGQHHLVRQTQPGHFSQRAFMTKSDGSCVHLGTAENENACRIYSERGTTCRDFEAGSPQCISFRRQYPRKPEVSHG